MRIHLWKIKPSYLTSLPSHYLFTGDPAAAAAAASSPYYYFIADSCAGEKRFGVKTHFWPENCVFCQPSLFVSASAAKESKFITLHFVCVPVKAAMAANGRGNGWRKRRRATWTSTYCVLLCATPPLTFGSTACVAFFFLTLGSACT